MSRSDPQAISLRCLHFEVFEVRLVLSVQPALEIQAAGQADLDEPLRLADHHASTWVSDAHNTQELTGYGQTVAVIDSGIAYDHQALGGGFGSGYRVVGGWDFAENDSDPFDDAPAGLHGTHIAGIIGGQDADHLGVAPEVDLVALRVFDDQGGSDFEWVENALQWVYDNRSEFEHPITTVNLSLGAKWSGSDLPAWATLEDEFLRLRRSGIFVAVAAGNSFNKDGAVGLNYPAASPHVVPVASHSSDNLLSAFSRRSDRVLVAPGEGITSTATDFIYDFNGITDDFYTASGTSMAAAYVSGASVLVRQAMEDAGQQNVTPDSIYELLRDTAQLVYDANTKSRYHHIDVQAALDAIMPSPVHDLGELASQQTTELFATADGAWYQFTAHRSGILTLETLNDDHGDVTLEVLDAQRQRLGSGVERTQRVDANVRVGQSLFVRLTGDDEDVAVRFTNLVSPVGPAIDVFGTPDADAFQLDVGTGQWLSVNGVTYDLPGGAESTIRIHAGAGDDSLRITATEGDDAVWFHADTVRMQGPGVVVQADGTKSNYVDSGGGEDRAYLHDSEFDDACDDLPRYSIRSGPDTVNHVGGFAFVRAFSSDPTDREWHPPHEDISMELLEDETTSSLASSTVTVGEQRRNIRTHFDSAPIEATSFHTKAHDVDLKHLEQQVLEIEPLIQDAFGLDAGKVRASLDGYDRAVFHGASTDDVFTSRASLSMLLGAIDHRQQRDFVVDDVYAGDGELNHAVFELARDAVYQEARQPTWLESTDRSYPVIDVHPGDRGYLAVDYLLQDDDTWT